LRRLPRRYAPRNDVVLTFVFNTIFKLLTWTEGHYAAG
jgi:hypothetical protein